MRLERFPLLATTRKPAHYCPEHADKVAWRIMRDWIRVQLAMVEMKQADMAQVFDLLSEHPDLTGRGMHAVRINKPIRPMKGFDTLRRRLHREKYIRNEPTIFIVDVSRKLDMKRIEDENLLRHAHWGKMRDALQAAPEFQG